MAGLFGGGDTKAAPQSVRRMSVDNSPNVIEAGRRKRAEIIGRSGRASTSLAPRSPAAGTTPFVNTFLGSVL